MRALRLLPRGPGPRPRRPRGRAGGEVARRRCSSTSRACARDSCTCRSTAPTRKGRWATSSRTPSPAPSSRSRSRCRGSCRWPRGWASGTSSRSTSTAPAASWRPRAARRKRFATVHAPRRRPRGDPLHLGDDGALQGRDDHAPQPRLQRDACCTPSGGSGPDDVLVHMLPLFHVHGLFVACHCVLMNGTAMRFHAKFDARRALADFGRSTVFMGVPTFYTRLLGGGGTGPRGAAGACGSSSRARRRCWPRRTRSSRSAPATASSSATG